MRRIVFAITVALLALFATGAITAPETHAQTGTPMVTVVPTTVATGSSTTVTGGGFTPNYYAYIYYQRPDGTYNAFYLNTSPTGTFAVTLGFLATHGTGTEYVSAYDYATSRWAPFSMITVISGTPVPSTRTLSVSPNPVRVGASTTISGAGFTPNQYVYIYWVRPDGSTNATFAYTDSSGHFSFTLQFLAVHGTGAEKVQAYDYGTSAYSSPVNVSVTS